MCFGDASDRISTTECATLRANASEDFPRHIFSLQTNGADTTWVVLEPPPSRADLLRYTICRISPCIMVMIEDEVGRRQIFSTSDIEHAMTYARKIAEQAGLAAMNAHPVHMVLQ